MPDFEEAKQSKVNDVKRAIRDLREIRARATADRMEQAASGFDPNGSSQNTDTIIKWHVALFHAYKPMRPYILSQFMDEWRNQSPLAGVIEDREEYGESALPLDDYEGGVKRLKTTINSSYEGTKKKTIVEPMLLSYRSLTKYTDLLEQAAGEFGFIEQAEDRIPTYGYIDSEKDLGPVEDFDEEKMKPPILGEEEIDV